MPRPKTPLLTVDCVIIDDENRVLLIRRLNPPFKGQFALPGGFVDIGETVEEAACREVLEETGLRLEKLSLVGVYSDPSRDPRGHICSIAFLARVKRIRATAGSDAAEAHWVRNPGRHDLAFDHRKIVADALILSKTTIARAVKSNHLRHS